jgi:hypothetical protein
MTNIVITTLVAVGIGALLWGLCIFFVLLAFGILP